LALREANGRNPASERVSSGGASEQEFRLFVLINGDKGMRPL
jgi:hypothetical protein